MGEQLYGFFQVMTIQTYFIFKYE